MAKVSWIAVHSRTTNHERLISKASWLLLGCSHNPERRSASAACLVTAVQCTGCPQHLHLQRNPQFSTSHEAQGVTGSSNLADHSIVLCLLASDQRGLDQCCYCNTQAGLPPVSRQSPPSCSRCRLDLSAARADHLPQQAGTQHTLLKL